MSETQEQREERIYHHLIDAKKRIEQDIAETSDTNMKRIEIDAAMVVTLALVIELLPEHIQNEIQEIIHLHGTVWALDAPPTDSTTPRKPLGKRLIERLNIFQM